MSISPDGVVEQKVPTTLRTVDLFCGCGGLTLGFDLHRGDVEFQTVLAADIDTAALRVFNQNFRPGRSVKTGRLTDLSWFSHRAEILLYYLAHIALWKDDAPLVDALENLGFLRFLGAIRGVDEGFSERVAAITSSVAYREAWGTVDNRTSSIALYKGAMGKLGLRSLRVGELDAQTLPWTEEAGLFGVPILNVAANAMPHATLLASASSLWDEQVSRFEDAAGKLGRGQHRTVAKRMATMSEFLQSAPALELRDTWVAWKAHRDSIRATFCLENEGAFDILYSTGRRVHMVLGGPPCKGWSRIGRAVIESLREQGVHAWACKTYGDERNALLHKYVLFLDALRPTAFLFENVAHFQSSLRTPDGSVNAAAVLEESINSLASGDLDFHVEARTVRARHHGVPQDRERYIMVGIMGNGRTAGWLKQFFDDLPTFDHDVPLKTALLGLETPGWFHPYNREETVSTAHEVAAYTLIDPLMPSATRTYLEWVRQIRPGAETPPTRVDGHIVRVARDDDQKFFRYMAPGMRWMDYKFDGMPTLHEIQSLVRAVRDMQRRSPVAGLPQAETLNAILAKIDGSLVLRLLLEAIDPPTKSAEGHHLLHNGYLSKGTDRHGDWLERLAPDRPCKTVVAHIGKDTYGYIHPYEARALSLREAARVQSFPDFFALGGAGVVDTYSMVGNAVPPLLAAHFAKSFELLHLQYALFEVQESAACEGGER